jgi:hypothetical protein
MPNQTTQIILRNGNFIAQTVTETNIIDQEAALSALIKPVPLLVPSIGKFNGKNVHLVALTNTTSAAIVSLDELPFRSAFATPEWNTVLRRTGTTSIDLTNRVGENWSQCLYPECNPIPASVHQKTFPKEQTNFPWPAAWGRLFFLLRFEIIAGRLIAKKASLFSYREREFWMTDYPNVHSHGDVCMGAAYSADYENNKIFTQPLMAQVAFALTHFMSSDMNTDLSTSRTYIRYARKADESWLLPNTLPLNMHSDDYTNQILSTKYIHEFLSE